MLEITCRVCNRTFKNYMALSAHVYQKHNITAQEYYDIYINEKDKICYCGKTKDRFEGIRLGYRKFCSQICYANHPDTKSKHIKYFTGKKQSIDQINKRIKNTNQKQKELKRQTTMLKKYNKISLGGAKKGCKKPRTKEHQMKIIESKRKNNTLSHSKTTKAKIKRSLENYWATTENPTDKLGINNNGRGHKCGYYNNIYYRSSYELIFILFAEKYTIEIESAENKKYRIRYNYLDKNRWYYPDFWISKLNLLIEIKPKTMITDQIVSKITHARKKFKLLLLVEDQIFNEEIMCKIFNEQQYNLCHKL